jgi:hypothetical protein
MTIARGNDGESACVEFWSLFREGTVSTRYDHVSLAAIDVMLAKYYGG